MCRALLLALALACVACDCGGTAVLDGGPPAGEVDAGTITVIDSGPAPDGGAPSDAGSDEDPEEIARELCRAYRRALLSLEQHLALQAPPARCSNEDPLPEVSDEDLPIGACGSQDPTLDLFRQALLGGRVEVDAARFRACLEAGRAARAAAPTLGDLEERAAALLALPANADCAAAITPLIDEDGASCVQAWDCAAPLRCEADPPDAPSLRCLSPALEGERCAAEEVGEHLAPRTCAAGNACVLGICTRRLQAGADCEAGDVPCLENLACLPDGVCGPRAGADESCETDAQCAPPYACAPEGTCALPPAPLEDGEPCEDDDECRRPCSVCRPTEADAGPACQDRAELGGACAVSGHCGASLYCRQADGACASFLEEDEPCGPDAPCGVGLLCSAEGDDGGVPDDGGAPEAVCQPLPGLGEACQRLGPWVCAEGACVDEVCVAGALEDPCLVDGDCAEDRLCLEGTCARAPRAGAPCTSDGRCAAGLFCRDLRCREPPPEGELCGPGGLCAEGAFCDESAEGGARCEDARAAGQPCEGGGQCASGLCTQNLTCSARGASCLTSADVFAQLMGLALLLPVFLRLRRRRR